MCLFSLVLFLYYLSMYIVSGIHFVIQFINENSFYCILYGSFLLLKLLFFFISKGYQSGIPKNSNISSYSDVNCQIRQFDEILHLPLCSPKEFGGKEEHVYQIMLRLVFSIEFTDSPDSPNSSIGVWRIWSCSKRCY